MYRLLPLILGLFLVTGCGGELRFGGTLGTDDDDTADDDDSSNDDDAADDDDSESQGDPVFCGPTPSPGSSRNPQALRVFTGLGDVLFDWDDEERGGVFGADWSGCEALHRFDENGDYVCGILWTAMGNSYGEQLLSESLVSRFDMDFLLTDNTCGDSPEAEDRQSFFRLELPFSGDVATIRRSTEPNALPAQMEEWASASIPADDPFPDSLELEYFTQFFSDPE
jgi:hypothetical protein